MKTYTDKTAPLLDSGEYPDTWEHYIGQEDARTKARIAAASAKAQGIPLEHTLIVGPPGIGKTALAKLIADELGRPARIAQPQMDGRQARLVLLGMKDCEVLVIDELQMLVRQSKNKFEWLLQYMQDFTIPGPLGMEAMPRVTIIGATSEPQVIPSNVLSRFMYRIKLDAYSVEEAAQVVTVTSQKVLGKLGLPPVEGNDAVRVAAAALCNPRGIKRMLVTLRDVTITDHIAMIGETYDIGALLDYLDISFDGLDDSHREYLRVLAEEFGGVAGVRPLSDRLVLPESMALIEAPLLTAGLIALTKQGRQLTAAGITRYHELMAEVAA